MSNTFFAKKILQLIDEEGECTFCSQFMLTVSLPNVLCQFVLACTSETTLVTRERRVFGVFFLYVLLQSIVAFTFVLTNTTLIGRVFGVFQSYVFLQQVLTFGNMWTHIALKSCCEMCCSLMFFHEIFTLCWEVAEGALNLPDGMFF